MEEEKVNHCYLKVLNGIEFEEAKTHFSPGYVEIWYLSRNYKNIDPIEETTVVRLMCSKKTTTILITPTKDDIELKWIDYVLHFYYKGTEISLELCYDINCTSPYSYLTSLAPYRISCIRTAAYPYFKLLGAGKKFSCARMVFDFILDTDLNIETDTSEKLDKISTFFRKFIPTYECKMVTKKYWTNINTEGKYSMRINDPFHIIERLRQRPIFSLRFILYVMSLYDYQCTRIFAEEGDSIVNDMFLTSLPVDTYLTKSYLEFEDADEDTDIENSDVFVTTPSELSLITSNENSIAVGPITSLSGALIGYFGYVKKSEHD